MADTLHIMEFGKYAGTDIEEVPNSYLEWLLERDWLAVKFKDLANIIVMELAYRRDFNLIIEG